MNDAELRAWHTAYEDEIAEVVERSRPRCETCRWWRPMDEEVHGRCERVPSLSFWDDPSGTGRDLESAYLSRDLDSPWLRTKPDFGCVQHHPKADI
jgi:hypothetical protein